MDIEPRPNVQLLQPLKHAAEAEAGAGEVPVAGPDPGANAATAGTGVDTTVKITDPVFAILSNTSSGKYPSKPSVPITGKNIFQKLPVNTIRILNFRVLWIKT